MFLIVFCSASFMSMFLLTKIVVNLTRFTIGSFSFIYLPSYIFIYLTILIESVFDRILLCKLHEHITAKWRLSSIWLYSQSVRFLFIHLPLYVFIYLTIWILIESVCDRILLCKLHEHITAKRRLSSIWLDSQSVRFLFIYLPVYIFIYLTI